MLVTSRIMKGMQVRSFFIAFSLLVLLLVTVGPGTQRVEAQTAAEIQQEINSNNQKIADIEKEIAAYQKQLATLGSQRATLATSIQSLDTQRKALTAKIKSLQQQIAGLTLELKKLDGQIATKQQSISLNKRTIAQSLRDIALTDNASVVENIFSSRNLTDAWAAVDASMALNEALRNHTRDLAYTKQLLSSQQKEVTTTQLKLVFATNDLGTQKKAVDVTVAEKNMLLTQTKNQESAYQTLIKKKRAEQASFEAALFELSSKLKSADNSLTPSAGKGILRWPVDKVVITQLFGKTADAGRLYASGTHDGMDFGTPTGTTIRAALSGTVVEINQGTVQNCQYGKWVLIRHANGLATLYAHLSAISVAKGQTVATGDAIGYAGMTGYATGPHLHFTVYNASSITFKNYTCKSGPSVYIPIAPPNGYLDPMKYL